MKIILKILKRVGLIVGSLLILIVISGLAFRLFSPKPHLPTGKLIDIDGTKLHITTSGKKNNKPTLVIEAGSGLPTEFYHWLNEGLKDSIRVVRYDRAGLGYSDECTTPRDPETVARELHTLLKKAGETPPYIMMGHSIGGPYIRVFTQLYPDEVSAMFFLDATHHDQVELHNAPKKSSLKYKVFIKATGVQAALADMGILSLFDWLFGTPYFGEGLPEENNQRIKEFLRNGKSFRGYKEEMKYYHTILKRSGEVNDFGALPIREFKAIPKDTSGEKNSEEEKKHKRFSDMSTNGKYIQISGNHSSIFTKKENATIICNEVIQLLEILK